MVQAKGGTQLEVLTFRALGRAEEAMLFDRILEIMLCEYNTDSGVRIVRRFMWISVEAKKMASYVTSSLPNQALDASGK